MKNYNQQLFETLPVLPAQSTKYYSEQASAGAFEAEWEAEFGSFLRRAGRAITPYIVTAGLALTPGASNPVGNLIQSGTELVTGGGPKDERRKYLNQSPKRRKPIAGIRPKEKEYEAEINFLQHVSPVAVMELLASSALEAESEAEAAHLITSMLPFAAQMQSSSRLFEREIPELSRVLTVAAKTLHRDSQTRPLIRTLPRILQRTAAKFNQQVIQRRAITPQAATQIFKQQAHQILGDPQHSIEILQQSQALLGKTVSDYAHNFYTNAEFEGQWLFELPLSSGLHSYSLYSDSEYEIWQKLKQGAKTIANWVRKKPATERRRDSQPPSSEPPSSLSPVTVPIRKPEPEPEPKSEPKARPKPKPVKVYSKREQETIDRLNTLVLKLFPLAAKNQPAAPKDLDELARLDQEVHKITKLYHPGAGVILKHYGRL